ncbi:cellulase family glycosylhydrolase [Actinoplanes flavus]|uniref:Cellulase family glycosylhydrolase n=1 Tax=Actinoplanes flavus TaxID=2820290 RepID=A0ABS3UTL0_9ACTN|nr:cellulase family glycosylhydrolase [Actinoplanes flavus]MBO3741917.1 cellulase family glycosylhydrolase [Actinoplanes flavus]
MRHFRLRAAVLAGALLLSPALPATPAHATPPTLASRMSAVQAAKTINYYPSNAGWTFMWTTFDPARIDSDLVRAAALGATNVRAIVFPQTFGYPTPAPAYAQKLSQFIGIAQARGLTVKLTLFDWWSGYSDTAGSITWAQTLLAPYADDPRVIAVEVKNEFPPGDAAAVAWVRQVIPAIRGTAPAMPLTLSVDGGTGAPGLASIKSQLATTPLDYYDYHFYGASERALAEIRRAQTAVAPDPVVIGETGASTHSGTDGEQAAYLARVFRAAGEAGVGSVAPWTLNDFAPGAIPPNSAVSAMPAQYKFGLYRTDTTPKISASVTGTAWTTGATPTSILNLGFEAAAIDSPWRNYQPTAGTAVITTESPRTGARSARFSATTRNGSNLPSLLTSPITPVQGGRPWHAEAYARGVSATGITEIALSWFDINGTWISQNTSNRLPVGNTGWTRLSVDAVAPASATSVQLHLKSGDNTGTVYYDDVAIS